MSTVCSGCHTEVVSDAVFCHQCGARIADSTQTSQSLTPKQKFESAAATISETDDPPEVELWQGQYSKWAMVGPWVGAFVLSLVLLIAGIVLSFNGNGWLITMAVIVLSWLGLIGRLFYRQLSEHYYLSDQRFVHERGLLWREINRIEAIDIDDVSFEQGPVERMLGVGTIRIESSDRSHPKLDLPGIENVRVVADMIDEVRRKERHKRGLHIEAV